MRTDDEKVNKATKLFIFAYLLVCIIQSFKLIRCLVGIDCNIDNTWTIIFVVVVLLVIAFTHKLFLYGQLLLNSAIIYFITQVGIFLSFSLYKDFFGAFNLEEYANSPVYLAMLLVLNFLAIICIVVFIYKEKCLKKVELRFDNFNKDRK